jgi:hypothetical protein
MKSRSALQFVVVIGIANFFADFTKMRAFAVEHRWLLRVQEVAKVQWIRTQNQKSEDWARIGRR